eukprot:scaffold22621_cov134-Isochrysis_galbana.AAC.1
MSAPAATAHSEQATSRTAQRRRAAIRCGLSGVSGAADARPTIGRRMSRNRWTNARRIDS